MNPYWSYLLTAVGVFGLWLAGRKDRRGWMVGIGAQVLWIAYATATQQWGFYISALAYGWIYVKNAHAWKPAKEGPWKASCYCGWVSNEYPASEWAINELNDHQTWPNHPIKEKNEPEDGMEDWKTVY